MMAKSRKYKFNPETLAYELYNISVKSRLSKGIVIFVFSIVLSLTYYYVYTEYLNFKTPKALFLNKENESIIGKLELMNRRFEDAGKTLANLQMRDNYIYRPIFGMDEIPQDVRDAGFGGVDRYGYLNNFDHSGILSRTAHRLDILYKKTFVQTKSFDDISMLAKNADEMSFCIPTIPPLNIAIDKIRLVSGFGYRADPFFGDIRMHQGIDLSYPYKDPISIYATGRGVVIEVGYDYGGYGNFIMIDHGFGYKTRYAHLESASISRGMMVERGDVIGLMGNTGKSKGKHLHYEVIYKNRPENPVNYFSRDISEEEFMALITPVG